MWCGGLPTACWSCCSRPFVNKALAPVERPPALRSMPRTPLWLPFHRRCAGRAWRQARVVAGFGGTMAKRVRGPLLHRISSVAASMSTSLMRRRNASDNLNPLPYNKVAIMRDVPVSGGSMRRTSARVNTVLWGALGGARLERVAGGWGGFGLLLVDKGMVMRNGPAARW